MTAYAFELVDSDDDLIFVLIFRVLRGLRLAQCLSLTSPDQLELKSNVNLEAIVDFH